MDEMKIAPVYRDRGLRKLSDLLPLDTPFTVMIDPCEECNFRCRFCPTGHPELNHFKASNRNKMMSLEFFNKIIEDLKQFSKPIKRMNLYRYGEPLLNPHLHEMVGAAKKSSVVESVWVVSNGSLLTREKARALLDNGLDTMVVSVEHVSDEGYRDLTQTFGDYGRILRNCHLLREEKDRGGYKTFIEAKIINVDLSEAETEKFKSDFGPIMDEISMGFVSKISMNDAFDFSLGHEHELGLEGIRQKRTRMVCPYPFYYMALDSQGIVSACCADWTNGTMIGDASRDSLTSIWNGDMLRRLRSIHLQGKRGSIPCCRDCEYLFSSSDKNDLDAERFDLEKHFLEQ